MPSRPVRISAILLFLLGITEALLSLRFFEWAMVASPDLKSWSTVGALTELFGVTYPESSINESISFMPHPGLGIHEYFQILAIANLALGVLLLVVACVSWFRMGAQIVGFFVIVTVPIIDLITTNGELAGPFLLHLSWTGILSCLIWIEHIRAGGMRQGLADRSAAAPVTLSEPEQGSQKSDYGNLGHP